MMTREVCFRGVVVRLSRPNFCVFARVAFLSRLETRFEPLQKIARSESFLFQLRTSRDSRLTVKEEDR